MTPNDSNQGRPVPVSSQPRFQGRLLYYLLRYKWRYLPGFFALLGASFIVMVPPLVLRHAVDDIAAGTTGTQLLTYGGMILGLAAVESVLRFAARHLVSGTARRVEYEMRNDLASGLAAPCPCDLIATGAASV
jgi:ABC-type multidrug transport system fused ATPase/permease subunit